MYGTKVSKGVSNLSFLAKGCGQSDSILARRILRPQEQAIAYHTKLSSGLPNQGLCMIAPNGAAGNTSGTKNTHKAIVYLICWHFTPLIVTV